MVDKELGVLEKTINLIDRHGIIKIFKAIFILVVAVYVCYNGINVNKIVEDIFKKHQTEHDMALEYRKKINPDVRLILKNLLLKTNADRAFVMEMHNGTNNVSGLPFMYGEMTYEEVTHGTEHIDEDYTNLNLSRFPFATFLCLNHSWSGSVEELSKVDDKLALRLTSNGVHYIMMKCMHGSNGKELGFLGITYVKRQAPPQSELKQIKDDLDVASNLLVLKLDINNIRK